MGMEVVGTAAASEQSINGTVGDEILEKKNKPNDNEDDGPEKSDLLDHPTGRVKEADFPTDATAPKDAVDEWPAPKQLRTFYFVRHRSHEDPRLKTRIEQADKELQRKAEARAQVMEALRAKKAEKADLISQLKPLQEEEKQFRTVMNAKRTEMEPLQAALGKLRGAKGAGSEKGTSLCQSEDELNDAIQSLEYRIQHESNTLAVEKQLLKEIKQLAASREKVKAGDAMRVKIQESFGQKDDIQDQVKLIGADLDGARKEQHAIRMKIHHLEEKLNAIRAELDSLQEEMQAVNLSRDKAYQALALLRKERDDSNAGFFQYRSLVNTVKGLVARNDTAALEELSLKEVDKFFSLWSSRKAFRDDYETRTLYSLDMRQLSRDGRIRNPDEKPILSAAPAPTEADKDPARAAVKKQEENAPLPRDEPLTTSKSPERAAAKAEVTPAVESTQSEPPKPNDVDPAKMKEMKREQEIAKAKLAMERKRKLTEKAAAKAAIRAQKEAEKKLKEKEKKAKKKVVSGPQAGDTEQPQPETKAKDVEPEPQGETNLGAEKSKERPAAEKPVGSRGRSKGPTHIPKAVLKRKKARSAWLWAAPAALSALVALIFGYYTYHHSLGRSR